MNTELASLTDDDLRALWPQAAGELRGFAVALERGHAGITADQLRLAVEMAEEYYKGRLSGAAAEKEGP